MNATCGFSNVDAYSNQIELISFLNELNEFMQLLNIKIFFQETSYSVKS